MRARIFRNICGITMITIILSFFLSTMVYCQRMQTRQRREMQIEVSYLKAVLEFSGRDYQTVLAGQPELSSDHRITLIAANGIVLYDSQTEAERMGNHGVRPEVVQAAAEGSGETVRYSDTLAEKTYYYAIRFADGTILRGGASVKSMLVSLPQMLIVIAAAGGTGIIIADKKSKSIIRPLNEIDLDHLENVTIYDELSPFIEKIRIQNELLDQQMNLLEDQKGEFRVLTDYISEGFMLISRRERLISYNRSAVRILGIEDAGQLSGAHILNVYHEKRFYAMVTQALEGEHAEYILESQQAVYQLLANPVTVQEERYGVAVIMLDITEKQKREVFRREFSANVSHELKTPLTSIYGYSELLIHNLVDSRDVGKFAGQIYREASHMKKLIEDIIRLSRLDEYDAGCEKAPVNLYQLADHVIGRIHALAEARQVELTLKGELAFVWGVEAILEEIIENLCENAIKYNRPDGIVTVEVGKQQQKTILIVADTGIGIAKDEQERVFERFYRSDKSHSKTIEGTGLGLSIVKRGVLFHQGQISVDSTVGKGTVITIVFPDQE